MKKVFCLIAALLSLVCLLSACTFTTNFSDQTGTAQMQAKDKVEAMMTALVEGDEETALALMLPEAAQDAEKSVHQLIGFLAGRRVAQMEQQSVSVNTSKGPQGSVRQEKASFLIQLEDDTRFYLSVYYVTRDAEAGFASFQIVLAMP